MDESLIRLMKVKRIEADMEFLYDLMTNTKVREYLMTQEEFSYQQHLRYWNSYLGQAFVIHYKGERAGLLREESGDIGIHLLPKFWNKGIGSSVLITYCEGRIGFTARIKESNKASIAVFRKAGFDYNHSVLKK